MDTFGYELKFSDKEVLLNDDEKIEEIMSNFIGEKPFFVENSVLQGEELIQKIEDKSKIMVIFNKADIEKNADYKPEIEWIMSSGMAGVAVRYDKTMANVNYGDFSLVFVDSNQYDDGALKEIADAMHAKNVEVVACGVGSQATMTQMLQLGYDFVQGGFLTTPNPKAEAPQQSQTNVLLFSLLKELQDPDASLARVEKALVQDPRLVYKLLRVVNSAAFGLKRKIESIREAIVFIGLRQIKRWAVLLSLSNVEGKPSELMRTSMIRAYLCETLGENSGMEDTARLFTLGLLSTLDALFDQNMAKLLENIPLVDEMKEALITHQGELGQLIENVIDFEGEAFDKLIQRQADLPLYFESYLLAVSETEEFHLFEEE